MPYLIQHRCHLADDFSEYGIVNSLVDRKDVQRLVCPTCREELVILTKGSFAEARPMPDIPGFVIPGRRQ